ncbi:hypothetical protein [Kozakia baliensis]|uniref:hypothetical protein n=1 Tax=Kozakia baliensis TaxID=153496 RepID=UPI001171DB00|nr:hypothetical protein [Kozakia baliensis]GEL64905.1 hypothetical protein KBA01_21910 [Kozakia baliensis]
MIRHLSTGSADLARLLAQAHDSVLRQNIDPLWSFLGLDPKRVDERSCAEEGKQSDSA